MTEYEQKQEDKRERYLARAEKADTEATQAHQRVNAIQSMIPMGQPILVGHHSEGRHRTDLKRIDRGMRKAIDSSDKAAHYRSKAAGIGKAGISSDDPDAIDKLKAKLARLENIHAERKAINAAHKRYLKNPDSFDKTEFSEAVWMHIRDYVPQYTWEPHPFPPYDFTNRSGNIRRIKKRISELEKEQASRQVTAIDILGDGFRVSENTADNRIQIFFDGKPDEDIRARLKGRGFRWAPSNKAWQRQLNNAGRCEAQLFADWVQER